jgi:hypothetical protein
MEAEYLKSQNITPQRDIRENGEWVNGIAVYQEWQPLELYQQQQTTVLKGEVLEYGKAHTVKWKRSMG